MYLYQMFVYCPCLVSVLPQPPWPCHWGQQEGGGRPTPRVCTNIAARGHNSALLWLHSANKFKF